MQQCRLDGAVQYSCLHTTLAPTGQVYEEAAATTSASDSVSRYMVQRPEPTPPFSFRLESLHYYSTPCGLHCTSFQWHAGGLRCRPAGGRLMLWRTPQHSPESSLTLLKVSAVLEQCSPGTPPCGGARCSSGAFEQTPSWSSRPVPP